MKNTVYIVAFLILISCKPITTKKIYGVEKSINIIDQGQYFESHYKPHDSMDVVVYRIEPCKEMHMNYGYAIVIYKDRKNDKKNRNDFISISESVYDQVLYKWDNDSTLRMRLYNSTNNYPANELTQILRKNGGEMRCEPYN
jgi:hypothetical protein